MQKKSIHVVMMYAVLECSACWVNVPLILPSCPHVTEPTPLHTVARKSMWTLWNYLEFCINRSSNLNNNRQTQSAFILITHKQFYVFMYLWNTPLSRCGPSRVYFRGSPLTLSTTSGGILGLLRFILFNASCE
jgi:type IV secretory pathway VirB6-like protein